MPRYSRIPPRLSRYNNKVTISRINIRISISKIITSKDSTMSRSNIIKINRIIPTSNTFKYLTAPPAALPYRPTSIYHYRERSFNSNSSSNGKAHLARGLDDLLVGKKSKKNRKIDQNLYEKLFFH